MKNYTFFIKSGALRSPFIHFNDKIDITIGSNEHIAIVGDNGAGKTLLINTILGKLPLKEGYLEHDFSPKPNNSIFENVKYISFLDCYQCSQDGYYHQQRWNSQDSEETPFVSEVLGDNLDRVFQQEFIAMVDIKGMLSKRVIMLSSGELRKFQLIETLLTEPRVLIIDNPYIGLDPLAREELSSLFDQIVTNGKTQIIVVVSSKDHIPNSITHVIPLDNLNILPKLDRQTFLNSKCDDQEDDNTLQRCLSIAEKIINMPYKEDVDSYKEVAKLKDVSIKYGNYTLVNSINWSIKRGDKWRLKGGNGAGKSTLLSLICADNPQSYACDLTLFGRKRGSGESIWDIKRRIGYVSPEMHRSYLKNIPTIEIIASGLKETIGLYSRATEEELKRCEWWMDIFGISELRDRSFMQLSSGEQRLALLARAFVKDPEVLILDEPFHGIDDKNNTIVKAIIDSFAHRRDKTIIMVSHFDYDIPPIIDKCFTL